MPLPDRWEHTVNLIKKTGVLGPQLLAQRFILPLARLVPLHLSPPACLFGSVIWQHLLTLRNGAKPGPLLQNANSLLQAWKQHIKKVLLR